MGNVVRQGVEGIGISPSLPKLCNNSYFTEVAIPETVIIPDVKPDMEELLSVMVDAKIVSLRIIKTPEGTSEEGQTLTGRKLSIELQLNQKVKYIADEPTQSVHAAHFTNTVNSIWVVVPKTLGGVPIETLLLQGKLKVTPYIEDIYGVQLDKRTVFKNITILINVLPNCGASLLLEKSAVVTDRQIDYTVEITNPGPIDLSDVIFRDEITTDPDETVTLTGDFEVDGVVVAGDPLDPAGVDIGDIPACSTVTVTYSVTIAGDEDTDVTNQASAEYEIESVCPEKTTTKTDISNEVTVTVLAP